MGAGKSSIGKRSRRLSVPLATPTPDREGGQPDDSGNLRAARQLFRAGERRVILRLVAEGSRVIATGGGAYGFETRAVPLRMLIWLNADLDVSSPASAAGTDPLLKNGAEGRCGGSSRSLPGLPSADPRCRVRSHDRFTTK
jgi:hypothetical protein